MEEAQPVVTQSEKKVMQNFVLDPDLLYFLQHLVIRPDHDRLFRVPTQVSGKRGEEED